MNHNQFSDKPMVAYSLSGVEPQKADLLIVWAHGWGHDHHVFLPFAKSLGTRASHLLLDFPGFGASPKPPDTWSSKDYAEDVSKLLPQFRNIRRIIWVGHSFGGRVGLCIASTHPDLIDGMVLLAGAGLKRQLALTTRIDRFCRVAFFKIMKNIALWRGQDLDALRRKYGSADYRNAGALRPIFLRLVQEDFIEEAQKIVCPTCLIYGEKDTQTPPEIGHRLSKLIAKAEYHELAGHDHLSVLHEGRAVVLKRIVAFIEKVL